MSKTTSFFAPFLCSLALALAACAAPSEANEPEEAVSSEDALRRVSGGGGRLNAYSCSGLTCTCTGDVDCNDMFSDGVCGDIATCDDTNPTEPVCTCIIVLGVVKGGTATRAPTSSMLAR